MTTAFKDGTGEVGASSFARIFVEGRAQVLEKGKRKGWSEENGTCNTATCHSHSLHRPQRTSGTHSAGREHLSGGASLIFYFGTEIFFFSVLFCNPLLTESLTSCRRSGQADNKLSHLNKKTLGLGRALARPPAVSAWIVFTLTRPSGGSCSSFSLSSLARC